MKRIHLFLFASVFLLASSCSEEKEECNPVALDCPEIIKRCLTEAEEKGLRDGTLNPGSIWDSLKRRCPDVESVDNGAVVYRLRTYPDALLVTGKQDMMQQLKDYTTKNKCCIKKLTIAGHGRAGLISTGDGHVSISCKHINGTPEEMAKWKEQLKDLKDILCPGATIVLDGCGVADGETGLAKLQEIAKEYGVKVTGATGTVFSGTKFDDVPDDSKRTVTPPVTEVVTPPQSEKDSLAKKESENVKEKMQPAATERIFPQPVKSIGFYDAASENIPLVSQRPDLPIKDVQWISGFAESIDVSRVYISKIPEQYESDIVIIVQYEDDTYEYLHTILSNYILMTPAANAVNFLFSVSDRGKQLLMDGIELSGKR